MPQQEIRQVPVLPLDEERQLPDIGRKQVVTVLFPEVSQGIGALGHFPMAEMVVPADQDPLPAEEAGEVLITVDIFAHPVRNLQNGPDRAIRRFVNNIAESMFFVAAPVGAYNFSISHSNRLFSFRKAAGW